MKLIHTADWHLGDTFYSYDRDDEHRHFLLWLRQTVAREQPDALLVSGDIFDNTNPSAAAERMLYDFLTALTDENPRLHVILTAGNHDSGYRLEAPAALYRRMGIDVHGLVKHDEKDQPDLEDLLIEVHHQAKPSAPAANPDQAVAGLSAKEGRDTPDNSADNDVAPDTGDEGPERVVVMAVPFLRNDDLEQGVSQSQAIRGFIDNLAATARKKYGSDTPLVLMAHFYAAGAEINAEEHSERLVVGGQDCVDATSLSRGIVYTALGHIHKAQSVAHQPNVRYAGSPIPMSFSEKNYHHSVSRIVIKQDKVEIDTIPYEPLRHLITVPSSGSASLDNVLEELSALPKAHGDKDAEKWPYLEVKVEEIQPNPQVAAAISKAIENRAVRLCRIVRVRPNGERSGDNTPITTIEDLQKINPAQIVRTIYRNQYGEEMPDDVARLFADVKRRCEQTAAES